MHEHPRTSRRAPSHSACSWWHAQRTERCANSLADQGEIPPYQLPTRCNRLSSSANPGRQRRCVPGHTSLRQQAHIQQEPVASKCGRHEESWDPKEITMLATGFPSKSDSRQWQRQIQVAAARARERHNMHFIRWQWKRTTYSYVPAFLYQHYTSPDFFQNESSVSYHLQPPNLSESSIC